MSKKAGGANRDMTDENILELFRHTEWPLMSRDIADEFGVTQQSAHYRLSQLHKEGKIARRKVSGRIVMWKLAQDSG